MSTDKDNIVDMPSVISFEDFLKVETLPISEEKKEKSLSRRKQTVNSKSGTRKKDAIEKQPNKTKSLSPSIFPYSKKNKRLFLANSYDGGVDSDSKLIVKKFSTTKEKRKARSEILNLKTKRKCTYSDDVIITAVNLPISSRSNEAKFTCSENLQADENNALAGLQWTDKYHPKNSSEIVGNRDGARNLLSWLKLWKERVEKEQVFLLKEASIECCKSSQLKPSNEDSDFKPCKNDLLWEDDTDICCTSILIGPTGCGKTSLVYACAQELGYKVLEVNASCLRNSKYMLSQLQEATQSHLVSKHSSENKNIAVPAVKKKELKSFFLPKSARVNNLHSKKETKARQRKKPSTLSRKCASDVEFTEKQSIDETSLILVDEADIVLQEDKGFLSAVQTLVDISKRPIILTANDKAFCQQLDRKFQKITLNRPCTESVVEHLAKIAKKEKIELTNEECYIFASKANGDIRQSLLSFQFWMEHCNVPLHVVDDHHDYIATPFCKNAAQKSNCYWSKLMGVDDYFMRANKYCKASSFSDLLKTLSTLDVESLNPVQDAVLHLHNNRFDGQIIVSSIRFLLSFPQQSINSSLEAKSLAISSTTECKIQSSSTSRSKSDEDELLCLAFNRPHVKSSKCDKASLMATKRSQNNDNVSKTSRFSETMSPHDCLLLKQLYDYMENSSLCDLMEGSFSKTFSDYTSSCNGMCEGQLDESGLIEEPDFLTLSLFSEEQSFIKLWSLKQTQKKAEESMFSGLQTSHVEKYCIRLYRKFMEFSSPTSFHVDYLPFVRCICRLEERRKKAKVCRRFLHYLAGFSIPTSQISRLSTEYHVISTIPDCSLDVRK